jgi:hypothetical protein
MHLGVGLGDVTGGEGQPGDSMYGFDEPGVADERHDEVGADDLPDDAGSDDGERDDRFRARNRRR